MCVDRLRSMQEIGLCYRITYYVGHPVRIKKIKKYLFCPFLLSEILLLSFSVMIVRIVLWKINISTHWTFDSVTVDHVAVYDVDDIMGFHIVYRVLLGRPCQLLRRSFFFFLLRSSPPQQVPFRLFRRLNSFEFLSSCFVYRHWYIIQIPTIFRKWDTHTQTHRACAEITGRVTTPLLLPST